MTVLTAKDKVGDDVWRKRKRRTIYIRLFLGYLWNLLLEANDSFAIPIVAHDGGGNESSLVGTGRAEDIASRRIYNNNIHERNGAG